MFAYQKKENDMICVQFKSRQVPTETPDITIEKDEDGKIIIKVAGEEVYSVQGVTFDEA